MEIPIFALEAKIGARLVIILMQDYTRLVLTSELPDGSEQNEKSLLRAKNAVAENVVASSDAAVGQYQFERKVSYF